MDHKKINTEAKNEIRSDEEKRELVVKKNLILKIKEMREANKKNLEAYSKPDHVVYDADGKVILEGFSKGRIDHKESFTKALEFIDKVEAGLEDGSYKETVKEAMEKTTSSEYYSAVSFNNVMKRNEFVVDEYHFADSKRNPRGLYMDAYESVRSGRVR